MKNVMSESNSWSANNARNTQRLAYWTAAWVASTALAAFGPRLLWDFATLPTILGVLVNLGVGAGMILANRRYLNGLDEMQQKIFLQAGALTLGVGLVCSISYQLLEDVRLIGFEPEISHVVILMSLTFLVGMIIGNWKYR